MRTFWIGLAIVIAAGAEAPLACRAEKPKENPAPAANPFDAPSRVAPRTRWTQSRVHGAPDPPPPYRTERAFKHLQFAEPLDISSAPGTDRLFVAERYGKVFSFPNNSEVAQADLFLDLGKVIYGIAFHPKFAENGYVYVTYVVDAMAEQPDGTHVARFQVRGDNPPVCDPKSEQLLLTWPSGGHNGGCLKFGPDGFLYIATGDAGDISDPHEAGQDLTTLPGKILRIDVDRRAGDKAYAIPADNPFVDTAGARGEIWAYGLRQPWKLSFDRKTGDLWTGNVGQDLWEMVLRIERGGNYGWSVTEGAHPFRPERKRGPTPILQPIVEHDHANFRSVTGGFVYHGTRLKDLVGAYLYGDYDTGRIWMLRYDRDKSAVTENKELVDSSLRLVGFAEDAAGELLLLDHMSGQISRLVPNPAKATSDFPRTLSATGLFDSARDDVPATGVIPYSVNAPQWCDGAAKSRYLALPGDSKIEFEAVTYPQPAPGAPPGWKFPDGTVLVETLSLEMEKGNPNSARRLETRILHHERTSGGEDVGDQVWQGYTYIWNDAQTDAVLLEDPRGRDVTFTIADPRAPGGKRQQAWHYPSRAECAVCHNMAAKYVLGVQTLQLNKDHDYGDAVANQVEMLAKLGMFAAPLPRSPAEMPSLTDYRMHGKLLSERARSYLHANCAHCHRKWGGGNAEFQLLYPLELSETGVVDVRPAHGAFGIANARLIAPGDPYRSVLYYRMAHVGGGRMPRLGSSVADEQAIDMIHDWIEQLPAATPAEAERLARTFAETSHVAANLAGKKPDERAKIVDRYLSSTSDAMRLEEALTAISFPRELRDDLIAKATTSYSNEVRDLFERFLPEEKRTKRLGAVVDAEKLLALGGSAEQGRKVFFESEAARCRACHKIQGQGTEVGPDLSEIAKKNTPAQLLASMLDPSQKVDTKYVVYVVETEAGLIHRGLLVEKDAKQVVLKDDKNELVRIAAADVSLMAAQPKSLMPDLLLRDMTAQDVADLLAFLASLK